MHSSRYNDRQPKQGNQHNFESKHDEKPKQNENIQDKKVDIEEFKYIEEYFDKNSSNKEDYINLKELHKLFNQTNLVGKDQKRQIDNIYSEHLVLFKKSNLEKLNFPYLTSFLKENTNILASEDMEMKIEMKMYYVYQLIQDQHIYEEKLYDFFQRIIKKNGFGMSSTIKYSINKNILYSNSYLSFVNSLAQWYTNTEISILNFNILSSVFNLKFNFSQSKYSLESNYNWSVNTFAKKNFLKMGSFVLRNANLGMKFFGSVNYASVLFLTISSLAAGISMRNVFLSGHICQYAVYGSLIFNWLLGKLTSSIDNYTDNYEFNRLSEILEMLNGKLSKIKSKSTELVKVSSIVELEEEAGMNESVIDRVQIKFDDMKLILEAYLENVEDLSEEEEKKIAQQIVHWKEEMVSIEENGPEEWSLIKVLKGNK